MVRAACSIPLISRQSHDQTCEKCHAGKLEKKAARVCMNLSLCYAGRAKRRACQCFQVGLEQRCIGGPQSMQVHLPIMQCTSCTSSESSSESSSDSDSSSDPDSSLSVSAAWSAALPACALSVSGFLAAGASTPPSSGRFASPSAACVQ